MKLCSIPFLLVALFLSACDPAEEPTPNKPSGTQISAQVLVSDLEAKLIECVRPTLENVFQSQIGNGFLEIETSGPFQKLFIGCSVTDGIRELTWQCTRAVCVTEFRNGLEQCDAFTSPGFKGHYVTIGNYGAPAGAITIQNQNAQGSDPIKIIYQASRLDAFPRLHGVLESSSQQPNVLIRGFWIEASSNGTDLIFESQDGRPLGSSNTGLALNHLKECTSF